MNNDRPRPARRLLAAALAAAFLALGPVPGPSASARAADSGDLERFLDSVVGTRGAGYAIVVDTSQSMANNGSYDKVRSVLPAFLESLHPEDLVCLIPFSESARACDMVSRDEALAELDEALPATPEGPASNFGRAFEQALDGLQRAGTDVGGVLLLSDAQMHAPDDVKYRDFTASGWSALRRQASGLPADRTLTGYGIALAPGAEVERVLAKVFPSHRMLDASGSRTREAMTAAQDDTRLLQAARAVTGDKGKGVSVSWPDGTGDGPVPAGPVLRLRLTATTDALPVRVTGLRVEGLPEGVEPAGGLPRSVDLEPGESRDVDVVLGSTTARREGWGSGPRAETWRLSVDGRVSTPVAGAAERFADRTPRLATAPAGESLAVRGTAQVTVDPVRWSAALGALLAVLAVGAVLLLRRYRPVRGLLSAEGVDTRQPVQIPLQGRGEVTVDLSALLEGDGSVRIRSVPGPLREEPPIRLRCRTADRPEREIVCSPGQTVLLCGIEFHYATLPAQRR
ncbi:vWA domain-containing protein [Streptomyces sp. MAR25Y5]|uniref:vWA domain-containing protein n=1 Tax=Streptomyces sp. MAR25Y5 TaxID=2962028 RepID=UPI0020B892B0|nr:vWA domain-containing protein [Streptomyces sp. MAR25Y5]MCP3768327.1 VWA domain-containing protein [Streptomyces sp. MAR25Y5]